jgi:hypothetical protein
LAGTRPGETWKGFCETTLQIKRTPDLLSFCRRISFAPLLGVAEKRVGGYELFNKFVVLLLYHRDHIEQAGR